MIAAGSVATAEQIRVLAWPARGASPSAAPSSRAGCRAVPVAGQVTAVLAAASGHAGERAPR